MEHRRLGRFHSAFDPINKCLNSRVHSRHLTARTSNTVRDNSDLEEIVISVVVDWEHQWAALDHRRKESLKRLLRRSLLNLHCRLGKNPFRLLDSPHTRLHSRTASVTRASQLLRSQLCIDCSQGRALAALAEHSLTFLLLPFVLGIKRNT